MKNLNELTVVEAREGLMEKAFSVTELVQACLTRISQVDKTLNAFITVCGEEALADASRKDAKLQSRKDAKDLFREQPLFGIPLALKDNFCTKGVRTTAASKVLENWIPPYDATVTARLKTAGAIIVGKTNMDAWAHGSSTETSDFGPTLNPWDISRLPGGSSGGSAAAVAANEAIAAIGSETAGSIRQPAAWSGVVGFKPTYGRVSRYGLISMCSSTDSPGPLTKSVEDAAVLTQVLAGNDLKDSTTSLFIPENYLKDYPQNPKKLTLGLVADYFVKGMEPEIERLVNGAVKHYKESINSQITIKPIRLLNPKIAIDVYTIIQRSEVSSNLARMDGIRFGNSRSAFADEAKRRIMLGTYTLSSGYYDQYYLKAQKVRSLIIDDFNQAFKKVDLLIAPATPSVALRKGASKDQAMFGELQDLLFEASSLAGLPGVTLPCGFSKNLPVAFQLIGSQFSELKLLQTAYLYEQATAGKEWRKRRPEIS